MADTFRPHPFRFEIPQGAHYHQVLLRRITDKETGEPFDFTADPEGEWTARMDVRTPSGGLVVSFATSGEDGVIELSAEGVVSFDLAAEFTDELEATTEYGGEIAGPLYAGLILVDPADSTPWLFFRGEGGVTRKVTF
jgi:hypothetical protein